LKITDAKGNTFISKNPFIINQVSNSIKSLYIDKLAAVEGQISLNLCAPKVLVDSHWHILQQQGNFPFYNCGYYLRT